MKEIYKQIKSEVILPVAMFTYTYKDFDGVIHPFGRIFVNLKEDEKNIKMMEDVKNKYGESFMFFNNSNEGKEFWKNNPMRLIPNQNKDDYNRK